MALIKAINILSGAIETVLGETPETKDVTEGFDRPATFITPRDVSVSADGSYIREDISLTVTRFAEYTYKGYLELLKWCDIFAELLTVPLQNADGYAIFPEDISMDINRDDMVLEVNFNLTCVDKQVETDGEQGDYLMEVLKAKYNETEMS